MKRPNNLFEFFKLKQPRLPRLQCSVEAGGTEHVRVGQIQEQVSRTVSFDLEYNEIKDKAVNLRHQHIIFTVFRIKRLQYS